MGNSFKNNLHWLIFALIFVVAWFGGQAAVQYFVPQASYSNYLSVGTIGVATFSSETDYPRARTEAYHKAREDAVGLAELAGKKLGNLTYIGDNISPASMDDVGMDGPVSTGSDTPQQVSVSLSYELK